MTSSDRFRLPNTVIPTHYALALDVDLDAYAFSGEVTTTVDVTRPVDEVILNAAELELLEAWVEVPDGTRIDAEVSLDAEAERATLALSRTLPEGPATVRCRFTGVLNDKLHGFYRTTYTDPTGVERIAASTQFEATHARRAFPCWDEPAFKASFGITLDVPYGELAISNAVEIERSESAAGKTRFRYADTMVMSTYLVAFVVGHFEATDPVDVRGVPLRIVYPAGQGHLTDFALDAGRFGLEFLADYYDIAYPGDKVDLVAIPDFAFGAMENLGCITFREVLLLIDATKTPLPDQQRVADVIFHELAHMWFGDLVTMKWWNGLWLNEAFATFMEMKATDAYRPEWTRWVDFGLSRTSAFDTDSLASTRPIEFDVISPEDAEGMFDILTYEKGAGVVRMVEQYLGEEPFRAGVRRYLIEHSYANTETSDLWDAIEAETGHPVRTLADSWIFQGGYPLITIGRSADGSQLELGQSPFRYLAESQQDTVWMVPLLLRLGFADGRTESLRVLLDGPTATVAIPEGVTYVVGNAGGHGFYRIQYSAELSAALVDRAQDVLEPIERYGLVDDSYAAVLAGKASAESFVALARGLADDDDLSVWQRLSAGLSTLSRVVQGDDLERYRKVIRDLAGPALDIAGWEPASEDSDRRRELRATLFTLLGNVGDDPKVVARAAELHDEALAGAVEVDPSLAAAAVTVLAAHGDATTFAHFVELEESGETPQDRRRYLYAQADFSDEALLIRILDRCRTGEVRTQDAPYVIGRAMGNRESGPAVWRYLAQHWDELNDHFPSNTIVRMLATLSTINDPGVAAHIASFFAEHEVPQGAKTLTQVLEKLRVSVELAEREGPALAALLA